MILCIKTFAILLGERNLTRSWAERYPAEEQPSQARDVASKGGGVRNDAFPLPVPSDTNRKEVQEKGSLPAPKMATGAQRDSACAG